MINIMYAVDPIKRIVKPMSGHAVTEQDHEASSLRFAFPDNIAGTGLDSTGTAVRVMYIRPDGGDPVAKTLTFYKHSGGYYLYDWNLQKSDLQKEGHLVFSLCILDISGGEVSEWHTTPCAVRVLSTIHTDDSDEGDDTITPTVAQRVAVLETMIQRVASGAPIVVSSVSAMTDTEQIYVLSTDGMWYYHNGSAWVSGGTYGTAGTDTTFSIAGAPADAKAVGDALGIVDASLQGKANVSDVAAVSASVQQVIPSTVRKALYTLLTSAVYTETDLADEKAVIEAWAVVPATAISLNQSSISITGTDTATLIATVTPANTTDDIVWTTSDASVATVSNGVVTSMGDGACVITATAGNVSATCTVSVGGFPLYTPLEYLESDGQQYINTGVVLGFDDRVELTFSESYDASSKTIMGAGASSSNQYYLGYQGDHTKYAVRWMSDLTDISRYSGQKITFVFHEITDGGTSKTASFYNASGSLLTSTACEGNRAKTPSIANYLFGKNYNDESASSLTKAKIYDYKVTASDGTLRQHLIPVLDVNGTPCMYDTVSDQYLYNAGDGSFSYT